MNKLGVCGSINSCPREDVLDMQSLDSVTWTMENGTFCGVRIHFAGRDKSRAQTNYLPSSPWLCLHLWSFSCVPGTEPSIIHHRSIWSSQPLEDVCVHIFPFLQIRKPRPRKVNTLPKVHSWYVAEPVCKIRQFHFGVWNPNHCAILPDQRKRRCKVDSCSLLSVGPAPRLLGSKPGSSP